MMKKKNNKKNKEKKEMMDINKILGRKEELPPLPEVPIPSKAEEPKAKEEPKAGKEIALGGYYNEFDVIKIELMAKILENAEQSKAEIIKLREIIEKSV